jgi:guanylate kinase
MRRGFVLVISGPSGAGKTSIARALVDSIAGLAFSVSATTRPPRPGEREGVDYLFCDRARFQEMIEHGELLEWASYSGNLYGTPRGPLEEILSQGRDIILDNETRGALNVRRALPESVLVFVVPPALVDLEQRIAARCAVSTDELSYRMAQARIELAAMRNYDYVVVNRSLDEAIGQIAAIITAERCRLTRQPALVSSWTEGGGAG